MTQKESIERIKDRFVKWSLDDKDLEAIKTLIPELADNDDDRIRKALVNFFTNHLKNQAKMYINPEVWEGLNVKDILAYLEKQKKQKSNIERLKEISSPADEDWFEIEKQWEKEDEHLDYISGIRDGLLGIENSLENIEGLTSSQLVAIRAAHRLLGEYIENYHKSTEWSEMDEEMLNSTINFVERSAFSRIGKGKNNVLAWLKSLRPQPKVEWSEEDKAVVDCITCCLDGKFVSDGARKQCLEWFNRHRRNFLNANAKWSEEDESNLLTILHEIEANKKEAKSYEQNTYDKLIAWLKSIKNRVQPKQEWSKEDEKHIESIIQRLEGMCKDGATFTQTTFAVSEDIDFLKSLSTQNHWKPSEEQIEALQESIDFNKAVFRISLLEDLKKLM